ncbi:MAG: hypothetical protein ACI9YT_000440 [Halobacteriales archaeon]|jgi:hypothetical protein
MTDRKWLGGVLDLVTYAGAGTALTFVVMGIVSLVGGYGIKGVKWGLFYLGWIMFGYGSIRVFPTSIHKTQSLPGDDASTSGWMSFSDKLPSDDSASIDESEADRQFASTDETKFQRLVQELPPARFARIRKSERFPTGAKIMVLSLAVLGASLAMEIVFGVG